MSSHGMSFGKDRPCIQCVHFGHWVVEPGTAWCAHPKFFHVRAQAERGCSGWMREIGADDEDQPGPAAE